MARNREIKPEELLQQKIYELHRQFVLTNNPEYNEMQTNFDKYYPHSQISKKLQGLREDLNTAIEKISDNAQKETAKKNIESLLTDIDTNAKQHFKSIVTGEMDKDAWQAALGNIKAKAAQIQTATGINVANEMPKVEAAVEKDYTGLSNSCDRLKERMYFQSRSDDVKEMVDIFKTRKDKYLYPSVDAVKNKVKKTFGGKIEPKENPDYYSWKKLTSYDDPRVGWDADTQKSSQAWSGKDADEAAAKTKKENAPDVQLGGESDPEKLKKINVAAEEQKKADEKKKQDLEFGPGLYQRPGSMFMIDYKLEKGADGQITESVTAIPLGKPLLSDAEQELYDPGKHEHWMNAILFMLAGLFKMGYRYTVEPFPTLNSEEFHLAKMNEIIAFKEAHFKNSDYTMDFDDRSELDIRHYRIMNQALDRLEGLAKEDISYKEFNLSDKTLEMLKKAHLKGGAQYRVTEQESAELLRRIDLHNQFVRDHREQVDKKEEKTLTDNDLAAPSNAPLNERIKKIDENYQKLDAAKEKLGKAGDEDQIKVAKNEVNTAFEAQRAAIGNYLATRAATAALALEADKADVVNAKREVNEAKGADAKTKAEKALQDAEAKAELAKQPLKEATQAKVEFASHTADKFKNLNGKLEQAEAKLSLANEELAKLNSLPPVSTGKPTDQFEQAAKKAQAQLAVESAQVDVRKAEKELVAEQNKVLALGDPALDVTAQPVKQKERNTALQSADAKLATAEQALRDSSESLNQKIQAIELAKVQDQWNEQKLDPADEAKFAASANEPFMEMINAANDFFVAQKPHAAGDTKKEGILHGLEKVIEQHIDAVDKKYPGAKEQFTSVKSPPPKTITLGS